VEQGGATAPNPSCPLLESCAISSISSSSSLGKMHRLRRIEHLTVIQAGKQASPEDSTRSAAPSTHDSAPKRCPIDYRPPPTRFSRINAGLILRVHPGTRNHLLLQHCSRVPILSSGAAALANTITLLVQITVTRLPAPEVENEWSNPPLSVPPTFDNCMHAWCSPSGWDRIDNLTENAQQTPAACTARLAPFGACCIQHQNSRVESRDRSDSQGIQRWPPPGDSEGRWRFQPWYAIADAAAAAAAVLPLPLPRLSPRLP
jgi:hypothetical protein